MAPSDFSSQRTASQKILCGIDGSDHSARAARVATELARKLGAELTFAMVNPRLAARAAILYVWPDTHIAGILERAVRKALWRGVASVKSDTWRAESVSDALAEYADRNEFDYIVIGAGDRSGWPRFLNDPVAHELQIKANCPVLIVNHLRDDAPTDRSDGLRRLFKVQPGPTPQHIPAGPR
ncbi:MAG TPA: universal stress protein [Methyloceanibacter sp.]|nr:universal stress protein [Methyloceanibacter sp.]